MGSYDGKRRDFKKASQEENRRFWVPVMVIQKVYKIAV